MRRQKTDELAALSRRSEDRKPGARVSEDSGLRGQKTDEFAALSRRGGWKNRALGFSVGLMRAKRRVHPDGGVGDDGNRPVGGRITL
ncbi:MAG: hypothetical protein LBD06_12280, partial [Candidatus Accumulibacter sp.]|nr:hypothetical protein [Accumulibacter sp.]